MVEVLVINGGLIEIVICIKSCGVVVYSFI